MHTTVFPTTVGAASHDKPSDAKPAWRRPWITAALLALVPVAFTAAGSAAAQILQLSDVASTLVIASAALVSAGVGFAVMLVSAQSPSSYGLRRPTNLRAAAWLLPALATVVIAAITQTANGAATGWLPYAVLVIAVALNEEFWFRGIILTALRTRGTTMAIYGSAALFGVLHLANLAGGEDPTGAGLQLVFAGVFGVAAAQLAVLTRSVWPAIAWHALWDFVNFLSGDQAAPLALIGVGLVIVTVLGYALILGRRITRMENGA